MLRKCYKIEFPLDGRSGVVSNALTEAWLDQQHEKE